MLRVPATIEKVQTLADGGLKLDLVTQELDPKDEAELMQLKRQLGYFVFAVTESITESDIPTDPIEFTDETTLDQRLNGVLYAYHMKKTNNSKTFHTFKRSVYEAILEKYKNKLSEMD